MINGILPKIGMAVVALLGARASEKLRGRHVQAPCGDSQRQPVVWKYEPDAPSSRDLHGKIQRAGWTPVCPDGSF